jgi:hypothetical protein
LAEAEHRFVLYYSKVVSRKIKKHFQNDWSGRSILLRGKVYGLSGLAPFIWANFSENNWGCLNHYDSYIKRLKVKGQMALLKLSLG